MNAPTQTVIALSEEQAVLLCNLLGEEARLEEDAAGQNAKFQFLQETRKALCLGFGWEFEF